MLESCKLFCYDCTEVVPEYDSFLTLMTLTGDNSNVTSSGPRIDDKFAYKNSLLDTKRKVCQFLLANYRKAVEELYSVHHKLL